MGLLEPSAGPPHAASLRARALPRRAAQGCSGAPLHGTGALAPARRTLEHRTDLVTSAARQDGLLLLTASVLHLFHAAAPHATPPPPRLACPQDTSTARLLRLCPARTGSTHSQDRAPPAWAAPRLPPLPRAQNAGPRYIPKWPSTGSCISINRQDRLNFSC